MFVEDSLFVSKARNKLKDSARPWDMLLYEWKPGETPSS